MKIAVTTCNPPPPEPCPLEPPVAGAACGSSDPCGNGLNYCTYGTCNGQPETIAQCSNGAWQVTRQTCVQPSCDGLDFCSCFERIDCQYVTDTCICPCDYMCPGVPPCECVCGGGQYLGCKAR